MFRSAALTVLCLSLSSLTAYAADTNAADLATSASPRAFVEFTPFAASTAAPPVAGNVEWAPRSSEIDRPTSRPLALPALYLSLAAFQAFDAYSTVRGLSRGAQESNPMMQHVAGNTVGFVALKAATAVVPMVLAERMWKHNKVGAITLMIVANGVAAAVSANNAQVLHQIR